MHHCIYIYPLLIFSPPLSLSFPLPTPHLFLTLPPFSHYRDMKPDNILLDDHGKFLLFCFFCKIICQVTHYHSNEAQITSLFVLLFKDTYVFQTSVWQFTFQKDNLFEEEWALLATWVSHMIVLLYTCTCTCICTYYMYMHMYLLHVHCLCTCVYYNTLFIVIP